MVALTHHSCGRNHYGSRRPHWKTVPICHWFKSIPHHSEPSLAAPSWNWCQFWVQHSYHVLVLLPRSLLSNAYHNPWSHLRRRRLSVTQRVPTRMRAWRLRNLAQCQSDYLVSLCLSFSETIQYSAYSKGETQCYTHVVCRQCELKSLSCSQGTICQGHHITVRRYDTIVWHYSTTLWYDTMV